MKKSRSRDGTLIAYELSGSGPTVILVDGALCSRRLGPMSALVPLLARTFTVFTYDRRGRNESGDTKPYSPQGEVEDLEAIIMAAGGAAMVFGMSSGAALAISAVNAGLNISKLALYEPPFFVDRSAKNLTPEHLKTIKRLIEADQRSEAVRYFQVEAVGIPSLVSWILRLTPMWKKLKAVAPTLIYDLTLLDDGLVPVDAISRITIPTAVFYGEKSPRFLIDSVHAVAQALSNGKEIPLAGQNHNFSAKAVAPPLEAFFFTT
ncbi:MAG TPA: alpha/beta hydrolase [Oligoflexus sp.]|uniref:alpha/beta fold hydrolase n=1 Tax=Oligoflexus sp. TaxID=1971216 RepID=UPI002D4BF11B|nr:alpha/beta hydrolase [Oligoflexus sp.]HYX32788.1 alpha/beta hydrolase [Oligoflexus sp.]